MRIAYTTTFDAKDVHNWSGTPYYMSQHLAKAEIGIDYIGPLERSLPRFFKAKQFLKKHLTGQRDSPRFNIHAAKHYSQQVKQQLTSKVAAVVSPLVNPIAYLECKQPIVLWTDALYAALLGFYSPFSAHSPNSVAQGNLVTAACLARTSLAIFSSDWAAMTAMQLYGTAREKIKVVPFGANIENYPTSEEVKTIIAHRSKEKIKLLFLAKSWERKGGDVVLKVAKALHEAGYPVELTIVGVSPQGIKALPYVNCLGFISKNTQQGKEKIRTLLAETHFIFVPSRAEAYGIVFCEANAFGVPCLTTYVGGIGTIVKDHVNGMTFSLDASVKVYCDYLIDLMASRSRYEALSLSAYNEYVSRLNWQSAVQQVKRYIEEIV